MQTKAVLLALLAIASFSTSGNTEESSPPPLYGTQGSVAANRAMQESEQALALQRARELKALRDAMAAQSPGRQVYTSASEVLAAHRLPVPPLSARPALVRPEAEVPAFDTASTSSSDRPIPSPSTDASSNGSGGVALPARGENRGLNFLGFFRGRGGSDSGAAPAPGASEYNNPYVPPVEDGPGVASTTSDADAVPENTDRAESETNADSGRDRAVQEATVGASGEGLAQSGERTNLLGRFFQRNRDGEEPASTQMGNPSENNRMTADEPVGNETGNPDPTSGMLASAPASPPDSSPTAPIFQSRSRDLADGTPGTISEDTSALVEGVKVRLFPGDPVVVMSSSDGELTVQLRDGRVGTVESRAVDR